LAGAASSLAAGTIQTSSLSPVSLPQKAMRAPPSTQMGIAQASKPWASWRWRLPSAAATKQREPRMELGGAV